MKITGLGNKDFKTKIIENSTDPVWNEVFTYVVEDIDEDSKVYLNVYDKDLQTDDFIGG